MRERETQVNDLGFYHRPAFTLEGANMEIKIVQFSVFNTWRAERTLESLIKDGWKVLTAGGGGTIPFGFVILQKGGTES